MPNGTELRLRTAHAPSALIIPNTQSAGKNSPYRHYKLLPVKKASYADARRNRSKVFMIVRACCVPKLTRTEKATVPTTPWRRLQGKAKLALPEGELRFMQTRPANVGTAQEISSIRPIVAAACRHHRLWIVVVLVVMCITLLYVGLAPRRYMSQMDILVQNKRGDEQITPSRINGEITINGVTEEQINSEIQLLTSRSLANDVVTPGWSSRPEATIAPAQLKAHDKAVSDFEKHLTVSMVRKSNVIQVSYVASDPKTATDMLNRLLTAFLKKQQDIAQPPGTSEFFAQKAAGYKQQLDQAQQQLAAYQQQNDIVSLPDSEQTINRQIDDAQTELRATDAQISELSQQIGSQIVHLKAIPSRQTTQVRTIPNDYSVERLNTMLAELENQRTALLTKFTENDRLVQQINHQIADTKAALQKAQQMSSQEHDTNVNPVWQSVSGAIIQNETEREALKGKRAALAKQISTLQSQLSGVEGSTVEFNTLRQNVADLQNNYQLYVQKRDEAQIADEMNANRLLNVAVLQNPTFSIIPYSPKPVVDAVLGTFTAMFFASFLVFFAEIGRNTFASAAEVEGALQFSVFAEVPLLSGRKRHERSAEFVPVIVGMAAPEASGEQAPRPSPILVPYRRETHTS